MFYGRAADLFGITTSGLADVCDTHCDWPEDLWIHGVQFADLKTRLSRRNPLSRVVPFRMPDHLEACDLVEVEAARPVRGPLGMLPLGFAWDVWDEVRCDWSL